MLSDGRRVVLFLYICSIEYGVHRLGDDFFVFIFFGKWLAIDVGTGMGICNLCLIFWIQLT